MRRHVFSEHPGTENTHDFSASRDLFLNYFKANLTEMFSGLVAHSGLDIPASMAVMNLKPGFVTPFGMLNDGELLVDAFLDRDFLNPPA